MISLYIIFSILLFFLLGTLSYWLNILYIEYPNELSFPKKIQKWQKRLYTTSCLSLLIFLANLTHEKLFFLVIYMSFLLIMAASDIEQQIIFDKQLALFAVFGLIQTLLLGLPLYEHLLASAAGGIFFLLLALLTRGGIGGGDIKLIASLGIWLGSAGLKLTIFGGLILGGIWALSAIIFTQKKRRDFIPYGPSFVLTALLVYVILK